MAFGKGKLKDLRFLIEKGADVSARDIKNNSDVHFTLLAFSVDNIKS